MCSVFPSSLFFSVHRLEREYNSSWLLSSSWDWHWRASSQRHAGVPFWQDWSSSTASRVPLVHLYQRGFISRWMVRHGFAVFSSRPLYSLFPWQSFSCGWTLLPWPMDLPVHCHSRLSSLLRHSTRWLHSRWRCWEVSWRRTMPATTLMLQPAQQRYSVRSPPKFLGTEDVSSKWSFRDSCLSRLSTLSFITSLHPCGDTRSIPFLVSFSSPSSFLLLSLPLSVWHCFTSSWRGKTIDGGGVPSLMQEWLDCSSTDILSFITSIEVEWVVCSSHLSTLDTCPSSHLHSSWCWVVLDSTLVFFSWSTFILGSSVIKRLECQTRNRWSANINIWGVMSRTKCETRTISTREEIIMIGFN